MIVSGPQQGSFEATWIQMNIGLVDALGFGNSVAAGANLRGHLAFLDLDGGSVQNQSSVAKAPFGQAAQIGHFDTTGSTARSPKNALLGVVDQDLFLGKSPVAVSNDQGGNNQYQTNFWCKIQNFGHCQTIKVSRFDYAVTDEFLFDSPASDLGTAGSVSAATLNAMNSLVGQFTFSKAPAATDILDLSGAPTTPALGNWTVAPNTARGLNKPYPTRGFLGWSYTGSVSGAVRNIKELNTALATWNLGLGEVSGFIACASPSPRG